MSAFDPLPLGERTLAMIDALAAISAEPGRLTRLYLTPEHRRAADLVTEWMHRAGLTVRMDAAATVRGLLPAATQSDRPARCLLVGSHIDTVIDAGRFDGALGVVAAILAVEELRARTIALPFAVEVLAFGDEEGARFPRTLTGASAVAGTFDPAMLDMADREGETLRDALLRFGCDPAALASEACRPADIAGYLEVHIEQGPVLERSGEPLGVVTAIAGQSRHRVRIAGEAGHAGTVPMAFRRDALAAAAEVMLMVEEIARGGEEDGLVATVGEIAAAPGAVNVIPGEARLSLDLRAGSDTTRTLALDAIGARARVIGARRGVAIDIETVHEQAAALCAPRLRQAIAEAVGGLTGRAPSELVSGAGHDGLAIARLTDIGMIFVRCRAGISHNPLEDVAPADLGYAVEALVRTIVGLARSEAA